MKLEEALRERILVMDGGLGTLLQGMSHLPEEEAARCIHQMYIDAGAELISTHTFTANTGEHIRERNVKYARLLRELADACTHHQVYVLGSIGPTNQSLTMEEEASFDALKQRYAQQAAALQEGGVDAFILETMFDTLNTKVALMAVREQAPNLPVLVSATLERSGRLLSGQTLEAFVQTVLPFHPLSIGLNCSFGAKEMLPYIRQLAKIAPVYISVYPNAGLPNHMGQYEETAESMATCLRAFLEEGLLNMVGGCCGTTPEHIRAIASMVPDYAPRVVPDIPYDSVLTGLEPLHLDNFTYVGERTNVAGSKKFARLIAEGKYDEALLIARKQVEGGAQVIDVCMDDAMLDAPACMEKFLFLAGTDPYIAKVPVMIDSSCWEVLEVGLKHTQGKSIVNSISLKEGEQVFLQRAARIQSFGAAVVVMAFDEQGQADTYERRTAVCERAYRLLTEHLHFPPGDIVFDPNVLAIGTGIEAHNAYAVDFIRTVAYIRQHLPGAHISGGVSNLSFAFRGNNSIREAMHSVFLYHAVQAGMDMAIVNPQLLIPYEQIDSDLRRCVEQVVLNQTPDATEQLIAYARSHEQQNNRKRVDAQKQEQWRSLSVEERLKEALHRGNAEYIALDLEEALHNYTPMAVIEDILMAGMAVVGKEFGEGKMFLPQVVKSAQVMKKAVSVLEPLLEQGMVTQARKKVLLATVKGDVHDIGKNIVGVVLACNGYSLVDLGVMVPTERIVETCLRQPVAAVCVSGLITPSLNEMVQVATAMQAVGLKIPLLIGGATTSEAHTASFIAPVYDGPVAYSRDASENTHLLNRLLTEEGWAAELKEKYRHLREQLVQAKTEEADMSIQVDWSKEKRYVPSDRQEHFFARYDLQELIPYIQWKAYAAAWKVKDAQAEQTIAEGKLFLQRYMADIRATARVGIYPVRVQERTIEMAGYRFPMQVRKGLCLTDFLRPDGDYIGAFAAAVHAEQAIARLRAEGQEYESFCLQLLCDRLAEACSACLFYRMQTQWWGFEKGIRPAVGYPSLPDHALKKDLLQLLRGQDLGIELTENYGMKPVSSVCGFYFANDVAKYF